MTKNENGSWFHANKSTNLISDLDLDLKHDVYMLRNSTNDAWLQLYFYGGSWGGDDDDSSTTTIRSGFKVDFCLCEGGVLALEHTCSWLLKKIEK